jgi:hypothetical protein
MDIKLTLKKNRKLKKKTISSNAKKRDIYSENAIMPIGKMGGGTLPSLYWINVPNGASLQKSMQGAITKYPKLGNWIDYLPLSNNLIDVNSGTYTLKSLKAVDAVKDGAPNGAPLFLADSCFGTNIAGSRKSPSSLKEFVKELFDELVKSKELKYIEYTRIKNKIVPAPELPEVHYDYYIPDCGPTYSQDNGKTPEVRTSAGRYPEAIYSLGNRLDTGPSSSNPINLHCNTLSYTIDKTTMEVLGYNNLQIEVTNTNPINYKIRFIDPDPTTLNSIAVTPTDIGKYAVGNASKNYDLTTNIGIEEKKKYLFIKSLGDTLIVYYWLWACRSNSNTISLLTCDSVVALQAFILGHTNVERFPFLQNAQFALNYTEKGEHHISKVYYKGQPPNYAVLFVTEKNKIIQRYHAEIYNFGNFIIRDGFTFGENITYKRPNLIKKIIDGLTEQIDEINSLDFEDPEDYKTLNDYELMPLIRSKKNGKYVLIRGRNKFSVNDTIFLGLGGLGLKKKPMPLEYLVTNNKFEDDTEDDEINVNGGSVSDNTSKIIGGRNDDYIEGEHFYKIGLDKANEEAIRKLQEVINKIYYDILNKRYRINAKKSLNTYLNKLGIISSSTTNKYDNVKKINPYNNVKKINPYSHYLNTLSGKQAGTRITTQYGYSYVNTIDIKAGTQIYKYTYGGDSGTLYEILTYYFHVNPDYTRENITNLIKKILDDYLPYAPIEYNTGRNSRTSRNSRTGRNSMRPKTVRITQSDGNTRKTSSKAKASKAKASKAARKNNNIMEKILNSQILNSQILNSQILNSQILNSQSNIHMDESK